MTAKKAPSKLRASKPTKTAKRLKVLIYGPAGVGKTTAAIQFPRPYLLDTERGAENDQYVDLLDASGGAVFGTTSFDDIVQEVRTLASESHDFRTLVIDPITVIYDDLVASWEKRVGTDFGRGYSAAKKQWKRLTALLSTLDMNVVMTSHAKNQYAEGGGLKIVGMTFDGPKGADYYHDLVLEVSKESDGTRTATVRKSRIVGFPEGESFEFSYPEVARRYGDEVLEAAVTPVQFATAEQVQAAREMLNARTDGDELETKWLRKAGVEDLADMTFDQMEASIAWLKK